MTKKGDRRNAVIVMDSAAEIAAAFETGFSFRELCRRYHCRNRTLKTKILSVISEERYREIVRKHHYLKGIKTWFQKGMVPHNKGKKGWSPPGSEKGWFKSGHLPHNGKPLGMITVRKDRSGPVRMIAIEGPKPNRHKWIPYARYLWEKKNGPVPAGYFVVHKDGDRLNDDIDNLVIVNRAGNLDLMRKNNPGCRKKAAKARSKTCRIRRREKEQLIKQQQRQQRREARQRQLDEADRIRMQQGFFELRGRIISYWHCIGCGINSYEETPPIPCPKCQSLEYERVEQPERIAKAG